jgi:hypothetical protein
MSDEKKQDEDILAAWALLREMDCPRTPENMRRSLMAVKSWRVRLRDEERGN